VDSYSGNPFINLSIAQADINNNIYLYSGSLYKITLPSLNEGIKVKQLFAKPFDNSSNPQFEIGRNGECLFYGTNLAQSAYKYLFITNTGTQYDLSTFKTPSNISYLIYNIGWQMSGSNDFYVGAMNKNSEFSILKIVLPDSFALVKSIPSLHTDMSIHGNGYNVIVNPDNQSLVLFPGIVKTMELNMSDFSTVQYYYTYDIGSQLSGWNLFTKDYYLSRISSKIYFYPKNIKTYVGNTPSILLADLNNYEKLNISTDFLSNKLIFSSKKASDNSSLIRIIDLSSNKTTNITLSDEHQDFDQVFYLK
jgi:hypothetical protein